MYASLYVLTHRQTQSFETIDDFLNDPTRKPIDLEAINVYPFNTNRHDDCGLIYCAPICEMKNEKYWFKFSNDHSSNEQEYQTMNLLKKLQFPFLVSDYSLFVDNTNKSWLVTKDEGIAIDLLYENEKISKWKHQTIFDRVKRELDRIEDKYQHKDFYSRNIIYNMKNRKITLIDFEPL